jgi:transcriptional repressor NF-X1
MQLGHSEHAAQIAEQLSAQTYECAVCMDPVRAREAVWNCGTCYRVMHLHCIRRWLKSSLNPAVVGESVASRGEWRCPTCQNPTKERPAYRWLVVGVCGVEWKGNSRGEALVGGGACVCV